MENKNKPGEKIFSIILLIISIFALFESIKMYMKDSTSYSYGALPLFLSLAMLIFMLKIIFLEDRKSKAEDSKKYSIADTLKYAFPKDILVIFLFLLIYCFMLIFGLGFEISSAIFLIASMIYLMRGMIIKNLIYTVVCMAFIILVFKVVFQVILP